MASARAVGLLMALALALTLAACGAQVTAREITVGAASSQRPLIEAVITMFEDETGITVHVSYGASGAIARQIEQGAPIDVFASADIVQISDVGIFLVSDSIFTWGYGHLVIVRPIEGDPAIETLLDADRIAIANPETAPYGAAAKQLMQRSNVWDQVEANVVFADTALQALLFAQAGEVDFAFVPLSLIRADSGDGVQVVEQNDPFLFSLTQALAVVAESDAAEDAHAFVKFFASDDVVSLMTTLGYTPAIELGRITGAR
jgi:molybdate transport system substrate-binding protein